MITQQEQIFGELREFLDDQIVRIERTLEDLDLLRAAIIRRDHGALENLQDQIRRESSRKQAMEASLQQLRRQLSDILRCHPEQVTISRACEHLNAKDGGVVRIQQQKLQGLVRKLRNEHESTELMLRECARFNRVLLSCFIGDRNQTRTYTVQGKEQWNVHQGLMNIRM